MTAPCPVPCPARPRPQTAVWPGSRHRPMVAHGPGRLECRGGCHQLQHDHSPYDNTAHQLHGRIPCLSSPSIPNKTAELRGPLCGAIPFTDLPLSVSPSQAFFHKSRTPEVGRTPSRGRVTGCRQGALWHLNMTPGGAVAYDTRGRMYVGCRHWSLGAMRQSMARERRIRDVTSLFPQS